jgi:protein-tyrosine-phosphatase
MAEVGIDISEASPKSFTDVPKPIHVIIAVCGQSEKECPTWPGLEVEAWMIEDPARDGETEESQLPMFRATRDRLREFVADFLSRHEWEKYEESCPL